LDGLQLGSVSREPGLGAAEGTQFWCVEFWARCRSYYGVVACHEGIVGVGVPSVPWLAITRCGITSEGCPVTVSVWVAVPAWVAMAVPVRVAVPAWVAMAVPARVAVPAVTVGEFLFARH
jgi:hypothetical protein